MRTFLAVIPLAFLLLAGSPSSATAQQGMRLTPEQRAALLKDSLALNDEQVGKVVVILTESNKKREEAFAAAGDDRDARMQAMRSIMDSTDVKIESLLTDAQKTKYDEMKKERMQRGMQRRPQGN